MVETFQIVNIRWDQKVGGILDCSAPIKNIKITPKETTNIYQMHRMRFQYGKGIPNFAQIKLELNQESHSICSFFSGFGGSTSPDGFTGNYGDDIVGIAERVICILLPPECNASNYIMVLGLISARLLIDPDNMEIRSNIITSFIKNSQLTLYPLKLLEYLDENLDEELNLSDEERRIAFENEIKIWRYYITELSESNISNDNSNNDNHISDLKKQIKILEKNLDEVTTQRDLLKLSNKNLMKISKKQDSGNIINDNEIKSDIIKNEDLESGKLESNSDQIEFLGDMAEINTLIKQLENKDDSIPKLSTGSKDLDSIMNNEENLILKKQLENTTESMRSLVKDLNQALQEKTNELKEKDNVISGLQSQIVNYENIIPMLKIKDETFGKEREKLLKINDKLKQTENENSNLKSQIIKLVELTKKVVGDFNKTIEDKDKRIIELENDLALFV